MLNTTVQHIYDRSLDEDGNLGPLDSGDYALILKLLKEDEATLMSAGRLQTVKKKNHDNKHMFNKDKLLRIDELKRQYDDNTEDDVLLVESVIEDIEGLDDEQISKTSGS